MDVILKIGDKKVNRKIIAYLTLVLTFAAASMAVEAQTADSYPEKPIQIVVPFAAGGGSDTLARAVGQKLSERWNQPVLVINKPGADGNIGAQFVANAPKDGYTLLVLDVGTLTLGPVFYKSLPFDPGTAFSPVTALTFSPHALVVNPAMPVKTFAELRDYSKKNPEKINFASHNNSAALAGYKLSAETGVKMLHIPYKGAGAAMTGLIGGEVNVTLVSLLLATPQINSGSLRAIAIASPKRMPSASAIPTLIEAGVPNYVMGSWQGMLAPAGTPPQIVKKLQRTIAEILNEPAFRQRLESQGAEVLGNTPEEFETLLVNQAKTFITVARDAGVKPQ